MVVFIATSFTIAQSCTLHSSKSDAQSRSVKHETASQPSGISVQMPDHEGVLGSDKADYLAYQSTGCTILGVGRIHGSVTRDAGRLVVANFYGAYLFTSVDALQDTTGPYECLYERDDGLAERLVTSCDDPGLSFYAEELVSLFPRHYIDFVRYDDPHIDRFLGDEGTYIGGRSNDTQYFVAWSSDGRFPCEYDIGTGRQFNNLTWLESDAERFYDLPCLTERMTDVELRRYLLENESYGLRVLLLESRVCIYNYPRDVYSEIDQEGVSEHKLEETLSSHILDMSGGTKVSNCCIADDGDRIYVALVDSDSSWPNPATIYRFRPPIDGIDLQVEEVAVLDHLPDRMSMEVLQNKIVLLGDSLMIVPLMR